MRIVKWIVAGVALLIVAFIAGAYLMPREVAVVRMRHIDAPPVRVYAIVNGFERFTEWSPWQHLDPQQVIELHGPRSGVGAAMTWTSRDPTVGNGAQRIVSVAPDRLVVSDLRMDGFPGAVSALRLDPVGDHATRVTWTVTIDLGLHPVYRWFGPFIDGLAGPDYERGLDRLARIAESD